MIVVLIDQILNGNMENVDVSLDILYLVLSALEIKLEVILLLIVMSVHSTIDNKGDVCLAQLDV